MKPKAESDRPELKPWMFGRFGYLQDPKYELPGKKKTLNTVQQVLVIHEDNPRLKWETLRAALAGRREEAEKLTVKQLEALVSEADNCTGQEKRKWTGKKKNN